MFKKAAVVLGIALIYIKFNPTSDIKFDPDRDVRGHNVLVTGASSGIGEQLAYQYAKLGANVYITARREDLLQKVIAHCKEIGATNATFGYTVADMEIHELSAPDIIDDAVRMMGGLDQVIINHAILPKVERWHGTEEDLMKFEKIMEVNFMSAVHLAALSLPHLKKTNGKMGIMSSITGKIEVAYLASYSASKFALDGFFSSLRLEFKQSQDNVSITICFPGLIDTNKATSIFDKFHEDHGLDKAKLQAFGTGTAEATAEELIVATTTRQRDCYYPPVLGTQASWRILVAMRSLWPNAIEFGLEINE